MLLNPLDVLFRDIKHELWLEEQRKAREPRPPKPPVQSQYANPLNWRLGKVVTLIHATEGSLGNFQEYFHSRSPSARRLLPANPTALVDRSELVFGDYWLHPHFQGPPEPESETEIRAIEARFLELMSLEDEWE
jgi:hypothetical protein